MQRPPDGRIPTDRAIQILSFKKTIAKKDQDRIRRILDPGAVGSIPPAQLVCAVARFVRFADGQVRHVISSQVSYLTRVSESVNDAQYRTTLLEFKEYATSSSVQPQ
jgi:hypothetical protein